MYGRRLIRMLTAAVALALGAVMGIAQDKPKVFWSVPSNGNHYLEAMIASARASGDQSGYDVVQGSGQRDPQTQISDIENAMSQGARVIVVDPVDPLALAPLLRVARERGVMIVDVGTGDPAPESDVAVKVDWSAGASRLGEWLAATGHQDGRIGIGQDAGPFRDAFASALGADDGSLCDGRTTRPEDGSLFTDVFSECDRPDSIIIADPVVPEYREGNGALTIASMGTGCDGVFDVQEGLFDATLLAPAPDRMSSVAMDAVADLLDGTLTAGAGAPTVRDPGLLVVSELAVDGLDVLTPWDVFRSNQCVAENRPACCWGRNTGCCPRRK